LNFKFVKLLSRAKSGFCKHHSPGSDVSDPLQNLDETLLSVANGIFEALIMTTTKLVLKKGSKSDILFLLQMLEKFSAPRFIFCVKKTSVVQSRGSSRNL
jgi:hypothetical protein